MPFTFGGGSGGGVDVDPFLSEDYEQLGKLDLTGFVGTPTLFDPASTNYNDRGFFAPWWSKGGEAGIINPTWSVGDGSSFIGLLVEADTNGHDADLDGFAYANGSKTARWRFTAHVDDDDSTAAASVELAANGIGLFFVADGTTSRMQVQSYAGQTAPVIQALDSFSNESFGIGAAGEIRTNQYAAATIGVGVLADKLPIYDVGGSLLGYIPIYATIT